MSYGEAASIMRELVKDVGSHYSAARLGWAYVIDLPGLMATIHAEAFLNVNRDEAKQPKPFLLPRPWDGHQAATVSDEERTALVARLKRRSALRDR